MYDDNCASADTPSANVGVNKLTPFAALTCTRFGGSTTQTRACAGMRRSPSGRLAFNCKRSLSWVGSATATPASGFRAPGTGSRGSRRKVAGNQDDVLFQLMTPNTIGYIASGKIPSGRVWHRERHDTNLENTSRPDRSDLRRARRGCQALRPPPHDAILVRQVLIW